MPVTQPIRTKVTQTYAEAEPEVLRVTEVKESSAAWWVGGLVAIVAILAVVFLVMRNPNSDQQVATAVEQGRLQGALESTQSNLNLAQDSARDASQRAMTATADAAAASERAARATAASATAAASNASDTVSDLRPTAPAAQ